MKKYQPDFNNPRVINRIKKALGFSKGVLSPTKPRPASQSWINKHFGQSQNQLSKYLKEQLLVVQNHNYNMYDKKCKTYTYNQDKFDYLYQIINPDINPSDINNHSHLFTLDYVHTLLENHKSEIDTLEFTYTDKADRLWHPLQNIRREYKTQLLSEIGLKHHYDVVACAPTLLLQYSYKCGNDQYLEFINEYLNNRTGIRKQLALDHNVPVDKIKVMINALFCGARLGKNRLFQLSALFDYDWALIDQIANDPFIIQLRADIKTMWSYIIATKPIEYMIDKNQKKRKKQFTSKKKWEIYFKLERTILTSIRHYFRMTDNRYFLQHDGYSLSHELNLSDVYSFIKESTGYSIELDYQSLDSESDVSEHYELEISGIKESGVSDYFTRNYVSGIIKSIHNDTGISSIQEKHHVLIMIKKEVISYAVIYPSVLLLSSHNNTTKKYTKILSKKSNPLEKFITFLDG